MERGKVAGVRRGRAGSRAVPLLAQRAASEGPRWTRAVGPSPATCPKKTTGHQRERETKRLQDSTTRQVTWGRQKTGGHGWVPLCSQNAHDGAVPLRCAYDELFRLTESQKRLSVHFQIFSFPLGRLARVARRTNHSTTRAGFHSECKRPLSFIFPAPCKTFPH